MKQPYAISIEQLTVSYDRTPVLWDVSFEVPKGELVGIIGPNGAGKSTLLKAIMGLVEPVSGRVLVDGEPLEKARQKVAYIPQKESVDWDFPITVKELVLMGRYGKLGLFKRPRKADSDRADEVIELVGLTAFKDREISQLSGGQQQRAFLARALIQEAEILFLDEPFAGIDAATFELMVNVLKGLVSQGKTVFIVHHDLKGVSQLFSFVILLNLRLVSSGPLKVAFREEYLRQAYGKNFALLEEAGKLAEAFFVDVVKE